MVIPWGTSLATRVDMFAARPAAIADQNIPSDGLSRSTRHSLPR